MSDGQDLDPEKETLTTHPTWRRGREGFGPESSQEKHLGKNLNDRKAPSTGSNGSGVWALANIQSFYCGNWGDRKSAGESNYCKLDSFEVLWETSKFRKLISITFDFRPIKSLRAEGAMWNLGFIWVTPVLA